MIKANIETEISPFVGTEKQSEELVNYILSEFEEEPDKIWSSNLFGKPLNELMGEGLQSKLGRIPDEERIKLQETLRVLSTKGAAASSASYFNYIITFHVFFWRRRKLRPE